MNNYTLKNYNFKIKDLANDMIIDIRKELVGAKVESSCLGQGVIIDFSELVISSVKSDIFATIKFNNELKLMSMSQALSKHMTMQHQEVLEKYLNKLTSLELKRCNRIMSKTDAKYEVYKAQRDARNQVIRARKAELARQAKIAKILTKLDSIGKNKLSNVNLDSHFYSMLGWLAKNSKAVYASIPDFAEGWFKTRFGYNTKCSIVESRKKTAGGYLMKWKPSFAIYINDSNNMPQMIEALTCKSTSKIIADTEFIFSLVQDYGFKFSKSQDVESIRAKIPTNFINDFNTGFNA